MGEVWDITDVEPMGSYRIRGQDKKTGRIKRDWVRIVQDVFGQLKVGDQILIRRKDTEKK